MIGAFTAQQSDNILRATIIGSSVSLAFTTILIIPIFFIKKRRKFPASMVSWLGVSGFFHAISFFVGSIYSLHSTTRLYQYASLCSFQSSFMQFFGTAVNCWFVALASHLKDTISFNYNANATPNNESPEKTEARLHTMCWAASGLMTFIPLLLGKVGGSGDWCWITAPVFQFGCFYVPLILMLVYGAYCLAFVTYEVIQNRKATGSVMTRGSELRIGIFTSIFIVIWTISTADRAYEFINDSSSYELKLLHAIFEPSQGALIFLVLGTSQGMWRSYRDIFASSRSRLRRFTRVRKLEARFSTRQPINNSKSGGDVGAKRNSVFVRFLGYTRASVIFNKLAGGGPPKQQGPNFDDLSGNSASFGGSATFPPRPSSVSPRDIELKTARKHHNPSDKLAAKPNSAESFNPLQPHRRATFSQAVLNIIKICLGSGVLALPFAYSICGLWVGIFVTIVLALMNGYSAVLLVACADLINPSAASNAPSSASADKSELAASSSMTPLYSTPLSLPPLPASSLSPPPSSSGPVSSFSSSLLYASPNPKQLHSAINLAPLDLSSSAFSSPSTFQYSNTGYQPPSFSPPGLQNNFSEGETTKTPVAQSLIYENIAVAVFGPDWGMGIASTFVTLSSVGTVLSYFIVIGELIALLSNGSIPMAGGVFISALLISPLVSLKSVHRLSVVSLVSLICYGMLVVIAVVEGISHSSSRIDEFISTTYLTHFSLRGLAITYGLVNFGFNGHSFMLIVERTLAPNISFTKVCAAAFGAICAIYVITGSMVYAVFGFSTKGNFIRNLENGDSSQLVQSWVIVILAFTIPLTIRPVCLAIETLVLKWNSSISFNKRTWRFVTRFPLLCATAGLAIAIPNFSAVLSVVGFVADAMIGLILPCIFYFKLFRDKLKKWEYFTLAIPVFCGVLGQVVGWITLFTDPAVQ